MAKEQEEEYYMNALQKLIKERKKIPKEERVKMRQDSIDEVNTTDLENWVMRPDLVLWEKPFNSDSDELSDSELDTFEPRIMDEHNYEKTQKRIWMENRVDFARMFYNKGEPYSLRKYKRIFKNEMEKHPHMYDVLDKDGNPKERIDGIVTAVAD